jgi:YbbR domain-containing protein
MTSLFKSNFHRIKTGKKQHVFFLFIVLSSFFWLFTKFSNEHVTEFAYPFSYVNLPPSKLLQNSPKTAISLRVKGTGFKLLMERFSERRLTLNAQKAMLQEGYRHYILPKNQISQLGTQLRKGLVLQAVLCDSLFFELGVNKQKKVPVQADVNLHFKSGYHVLGAVDIFPDSIQVKGPEIQVDQIDFVQMEPLTLEAVFEDVAREVSLQFPEKLDKLTYSIDKVTLRGKVEKFTEGVFEIPFEIEGLPKGARITTYPKTVRVVFQVGLSNYNKVVKTDFQVRCNYALSKDRPYHYLRPKLVKKPSWVSNVKIVPERIEYLIQQ